MWFWFPVMSIPVFDITEARYSCSGTLGYASFHRTPGREQTICKDGIHPAPGAKLGTAAAKALCNFLSKLLQRVTRCSRLLSLRRGLQLTCKRTYPGQLGRRNYHRSFWNGAAQCGRSPRCRLCRAPLLARRSGRNNLDGNFDRAGLGNRRLDRWPHSTILPLHRLSVARFPLVNQTGDHLSRRPQARNVVVDCQDNVFDGHGSMLIAGSEIVVQCAAPRYDRQTIRTRRPVRVVSPPVAAGSH